jgi:hypothetical protein
MEGYVNERSSYYYNLHYASFISFAGWHNISFYSWHYQFLEKAEKSVILLRGLFISPFFTY